MTLEHHQRPAYLDDDSRVLDPEDPAMLDVPEDALPDWHRALLRQRGNFDAVGWLEDAQAAGRRLRLVDRGDGTTIVDLLHPDDAVPTPTDSDHLAELHTLLRNLGWAMTSA